MEPDSIPSEEVNSTTPKEEPAVSSANAADHPAHISVLERKSSFQQLNNSVETDSLSLNQARMRAATSASASRAAQPPPPPKPTVRSTSVGILDKPPAASSLFRRQAAGDVVQRSLSSVVAPSSHSLDGDGELCVHYFVIPPTRNDRPFSDNSVIWDPMSLVGGSN